MKKILVAGSINMDLVAVTRDFPQPGQTVIGDQFTTFPGGKGANQAVAAGRLGGDVAFLGKVGDDVFADQSLASLRSAGVDTTCVVRHDDVGTGVAIIEVSRSGENTIVVVPGANGCVDVAYTQQNTSLINACDIVLLQLEIPLETVIFIAQYAKELGKIVILDPAPACMLPDELIGCCDYITPNETEMKIITGQAICDSASLTLAAQVLLHKGAKNIINKAGKTGAYLINSHGCVHIPGFHVMVMDTTAAGDSFNAGFAVSLSLSKPVEESIRYANAVAAISVSKLGAQSAMPTVEEVKDFLESQLERKI